MQIQTLEEKTGLDRATIRYYEKEGLIQPQRLQNGYRDYSQKQLNDLLKIKLFRQLGLSLETIQQLIDEKDDLKDVLKNQMVILKAHKDQINSAEMICKMILEDNVTYKTMEPNKYICAMNATQRTEKQVIDLPASVSAFVQHHPFRRFWGRYLDQMLISAVLMLIIVVFMRVRPFVEVHNILLSIVALILSMPINALFLCLFGTTPGKFAFGIFLKSPNGKNLSYFSALRREWDVFRYGCGFCVPIISWICLFKAYRIHTQDKELEWDYDTDVIYNPCGFGRIVCCTILCLFCFIAIPYSAIDSQFPKYRDENVTIEQFSENYNHYARKYDSMERLSAEGEWYFSASTPTLVFDDSPEIIEQWHFENDSNHKLKKIIVLTNSNTIFIANNKLRLVVLTAILSQPNSNISTANDVTEKLSEMFLVSDLADNRYVFDNIVVEFMKVRPEEYSEDFIQIEIILP